MTHSEMIDAFDRHEDEYLKFERIGTPLHRRRDICILLMFDAMPSSASGRDIIGGASHDEIWFDLDMEEFAKCATDDLICDLRRCGVHYDSGGGCLSMFL